MVWVFSGITACILLGWCLYQLSKNNTAGDSDQAPDVENNTDNFENLLWIGGLFNEAYNDEHHEPSDNMESEDYNAGDSGFDDGGGFEQ